MDNTILINNFEKSFKSIAENCVDSDDVWTKLCTYELPFYCSNNLQCGFNLPKKILTKLYTALGQNFFLDFSFYNFLAIDLLDMFSLKLDQELSSKDVVSRKMFITLRQIPESAISSEGEEQILLNGHLFYTSASEVPRIFLACKEVKGFIYVYQVYSHDPCLIKKDRDLFGFTTKSIFAENLLLDKSKLFLKCRIDNPLITKLYQNYAIYMSSYLYGMSLKVYNLTLKYTQKRKQFNKRLIDFQAVKFSVAEIYTELAVYQNTLNMLAKSSEHIEEEQFLGVKHLIKDGITLYKNVCAKGMQLFGAHGLTEIGQIETFYRKRIVFNFILESSFMGIKNEEV